MHDILVTCIVGAFAGWIAGALVNFNSGSFLLDVLIGIIGGYIAVNWIFHGVLNLTHNHYIDLVVTSTIGAAILSFVLKLLRRRSRP